MSVELKPCPFCGGEAEYFEERIFRVPFRNLSWRGVKCKSCGGAYIDTDIKHCQNDTEEAWNKRTFGMTVNQWHRVEELPDEKEDAIFYYEWTGISGTVYRETSIISLNELIALGCRPIAWMPMPEPPKEDA